MPQPQRIVPLILFKRAPAQAVATGDNASWICVCRRALPLIGQAGSADGVTQATKVICPDCNRAYFVVPDAKGEALEVREV